MRHNAFIIVISLLLLVFIVFGLSKLIPRPALESIKPPSQAPPPSTNPSPTAHVYTNTDFGFSVTLPTDWQPQPTSNKVDFVFQDQTLATIEIKSQDQDQAVSDFRSQISPTKTLRITHEREVRVDSIYAKQLTLQDSASSTTAYYRFVPKGEKTYVLTSGHLTFLDSFTFASPSPSPTP